VVRAKRGVAGMAAGSQRAAAQAKRGAWWPGMAQCGARRNGTALDAAHSAWHSTAWHRLAPAGNCPPGAGRNSCAWHMAWAKYKSKLSYLSFVPKLEAEWS
jgi:hypothetical protein